MARVALDKGQQRAFILKTRELTGLDWKVLARTVGISSETLKDWRRERYLASYGVLLKLSKVFGVPLRKSLKILPEHWHTSEAGKKGAQARMKIYGLLGTHESRRKGGLVSQQRRRNNPGAYKKIGCIVRKEIRYPSPSLKLAEAFGIILGDGGINPFQVSITLHSFDDREYSVFVKNLFEELFSIKVASRKYISRKKILILQMSGVNLVEFLVAQGLKVDSKVRQQVVIPNLDNGKTRIFVGLPVRLNGH